MPTYPTVSDPQAAGHIADGTTISHQDEHGRTITIWENVLYHGADPTGVADSTGAIQAAIDTALGGPMSATVPTPTRTGTDATAVVYLPAGTYKITAPLVIRAVRGITFRGAGSFGTAIRVSAAMTQAIQLLGVSLSTIEGFQITTDGGVTGPYMTYGISWDWTPAQTGVSSSRVMFHDIQVHQANFKYGFGIGVLSANYDVSMGEFTHCMVSGNNTMGSANTTQWQSAFQIGNGTGGNVLNHYFTDCHTYGVKTSYEVHQVNNVSVSHSDATQVENYVYMRGAGAVKVRDTRVEDSWCLGRTSGGASWVTHMSFENVGWVNSLFASTDGYFIRQQEVGTVQLNNCNIGRDTYSGNYQKVYCSASPAVGQITVDIKNTNMWGQGSDASQFVVASGTTQVMLNTSGLVITDNADSHLRHLTPQRIDYNLTRGLQVGSIDALKQPGVDQGAYVILANPGDDTTGARGIIYQDGPDPKWYLYQVASAGDILFLRDITNARMHATFTQGATLAAAITELNSELKLLGALNHDGTTVGFYGSTPVTKPTVTGSRAGNAALASLLTQLASQGLITDSSTV